MEINEDFFSIWVKKCICTYIRVLFIYLAYKCDHIETHVSYSPDLVYISIRVFEGQNYSDKV